MKKALIALLMGFMALPAIATNTNSIVENLQELIEARDAITNAIVQKGGTVTSGALKDVPQEILDIPDPPTPTPPVLIDKTITNNATYYASEDNADGYNEVTVNVQGGGGGSGKLPSLVDGSITSITTNDIAGVTEIRPYAFFECSSLTSVTIPASVTEIGANAFNNCGVTSLSFADASAITSIGEFAFSGCSIANNLTFDYQSGGLSIGVDAFGGLDDSYKITITGASYADISNMLNYPFGLSNEQVCGDWSESSVVANNGAGSVEVTKNVVGTLSEYDEMFAEVLMDQSEQLVVGDAVTEIDFTDFGNLSDAFSSIKFRGRSDVSSWSGYPWGFDPSNIYYDN